MFSNYPILIMFLKNKPLNRIGPLKHSLKQAFTLPHPCHVPLKTKLENMIITLKQRLKHAFTLPHPYHVPLNKSIKQKRYYRKPLKLL